MARFTSPEKQGDKQAQSVIRDLQKAGAYRSVRTSNNHRDALKAVATTLARHGQNLKDLTPDSAKEYLLDRAVEVGQSQLDMERHALQTMMVHVTHQLPENASLDRIHTEKTEHETSRAYSQDQVKMIMDCQRERNALSTEIAHSAGLRAHELLTIRPVSEQPPSDRYAENNTPRWEGREGVSYTVVGKGGLVREIQLPQELADRLEDRRLEEPCQVTDRGVFYESHYDIAGGNNWSSSFTQAAQRALGWSEGGHGMRHSFAQERMRELQEAGHERSGALKIVSEELGHFRPEITEVYLR
jgi:integrase